MSQPVTNPHLVARKAVSAGPTGRASVVAAFCLGASVGLGVTPLAAQEHPAVGISNGEIEAILYIPDVDDGFYRATRFEWAGNFGGLRYRGHEYFAPWSEPHDPTSHAAASGPVQEFVIDGVDYAGQGYDDAAPGETFVKIGVGVLRRPDEEAYRFSRLYEIVDHGDWSVETRPDAVDFGHRLSDPGSGYAYHYGKTVRLEPNAPVMVLEHVLRNDGDRTIEGAVYNHNFMLIDGDPPGPHVVLTHPFELRVTQTGPRSLLEVDGSQFTFARSLEAGESVRYEFDGFGETAEDYDIRVENHRTGAGVRIMGDRPLSHMVFWAAPAVISPEAYIELNVEPGEEFRWSASYTFYTMTPSASSTNF